MRISLSLMLAIALASPPALAADGDSNEHEALRKELADARRELAEAARHVAELGRELGAEAGENLAFRIHAPRRPMLGIAVGNERDGGDGVEVLSVTPGGPADKAGIQAGDIITAIATEEDETELTGIEAPSDALVETVNGLESGDVVELRYRRGDDERTASVTLETLNPGMFRVMTPGELPLALPRFPAFLELMHGWGDIELAPVSEELGEYFGTDRGLLVVRAPDEDEFKLRDGDIILAIGGREPEDPGHAMRILRSYRPGEALVLDILRQREEMTLEIVVPERRSSMVMPHAKHERVFKFVAPE